MARTHNDPLEASKVVTPGTPIAPAFVAKPEPPPVASVAVDDVPKPAPPLGREPPRFRVLKDKIVSLGAQMATIRAGRIVSDASAKNFVATLREQGVELEPL